MKVVLQRVLGARVEIEKKPFSEIGKGYLLLVGLLEDDQDSDLEKVAKKIANLRIFEDENGKTNLSLAQVGGSILSVSQFTLAADIKGGNRPGFSKAMEPTKAKQEYLRFNEMLRGYGYEVKEGQFGADMRVFLTNDGPFTLILDSREL